MCVLNNMINNSVRFFNVYFTGLYSNIIIGEELITNIGLSYKYIQGYEEQPKTVVTYKIVANTSSFKCVLSNVYFKYYLKDHKFTTNVAITCARTPCQFTQLKQY